MIDLSKTTWRYTAHFNMGYEEPTRDKDGKEIGPEPRHKGYRYRNECDQYPRLHYIDSHYKLPRKYVERAWYVDGDLVGVGDAGLSAAMIALAKPVVLTLGEFYVLSRIPRGVHIDGNEYLRMIVGRDAPDMDNQLADPTYNAVWTACNYLRFKGILKWREGKMERVI